MYILMNFVACNADGRKMAWAEEEPPPKILATWDLIPGGVGVDAGGAVVEAGAGVVPLPHMLMVLPSYRQQGNQPPVAVLYVVIHRTWRMFAQVVADESWRPPPCLNLHVVFS